MSAKDDFLSRSLEPDVYEIDAGGVLTIVESLLRIVLAFLPPEKAKGQIDRVAALLANEAAEELERRKFG